MLIPHSQLEAVAFINHEDISQTAPRNTINHEPFHAVHQATLAISSHQGTSTTSCIQGTPTMSYNQGAPVMSRHQAAPTISHHEQAFAVSPE